MSQQLTREEELIKINKAKRERDQKRFTTMWVKRFVIAYLLCIAVYVIYLFAFQGLTIEFTGNIQRHYAKYLVKQNDEFITLMVEFEALTSKTNVVYSQEEKAAIKENLEKQNAFLEKMQKRAPDDTNLDYVDLYQDMLQIYAFYIQGEIMKAEYCYAYNTNFTLENQYSNSETSLETYTMGQELCNMFGNMILNNYKYINEIRGTEYKSQHNIIELGSSNNSTETPEDSGSSESPSEEESDNVETEDDAETSSDTTTQQEPVGDQ